MKFKLMNEGALLVNFKNNGLSKLPMKVIAFFIKSELAEICIPEPNPPTYPSDDKINRIVELIYPT